jgi:DNA replication protein DnaC
VPASCSSACKRHVRACNFPRALAKLDGYDLLILDDISYVRKDQAETSVLFELIAERYERRSILITATSTAVSVSEPRRKQQGKAEAAPGVRASSSRRTT